MPSAVSMDDTPSQQTIDELWKSKVKLHGRCLTLFSKLTDAQMRIAELEAVISAMRYSEKPSDLENFRPCETEAFAADA